MHIAITGASSGIGEALARELGRAGHALTLVARRKELLDKLASEVGGKPNVVTRDLSDPATAAEWLAPAESVHGPIDVLVNNAGIENTGPFELCDEAGLSRLIRTNVETPMLLARRLVPAMVARGKGAIVNVASVAALAPVALQATYAGSKAALAAWSETLRVELGATGVHVLTVYPGPVKTAMADAAYEVFGGRKGVAGLLPEGTPDVLARRIRVALERRRARVIYPRFYAITRCFPATTRFLNALVGSGLRAQALAAKKG